MRTILYFALIFGGYSCKKESVATRLNESVSFYAIPEIEPGTPQPIIDLIAKNYKNWAPWDVVIKCPFQGDTVYARQERHTPPRHTVYRRDGSLLCMVGGEVPEPCHNNEFFPPMYGSMIVIYRNWIERPAEITSLSFPQTTIQKRFENLKVYCTIKEKCNDVADYQVTLTTTDSLHYDVKVTLICARVVTDPRYIETDPFDDFRTRFLKTGPAILRSADSPLIADTIMVVP